MYRFRFFKAMISAVFRSQQPLDAERTLYFRAIPLVDTDWGRLFTHTYSSLMGLARWHLMFNSPFRAAAMKKGWFPVTSAEVIQYIKPVKAFEKITLKTKIVYWDDARFYLQHHFFIGEKLCSVCLIEGLMRDKNGPIQPSRAFSELGVSLTPPIPNKELFNQIESLKGI